MFFLAAGDGEDTFWIQLLVIVILAAGVGVFGVIKKHRVRYGSAGELIGRTLNGLVRRGRDLAIRRVRRMSELRQALIPAIHRTKTKLGLIFNPGPSKENRKSTQWEALSVTRPSMPKTGRAARLDEASSRGRAKRGKRDFDSGMELLTRDFLVEVVERTGSAEMRDVTMRNLCFTELVRRGELGAVSSDALKTYTLNTEGVFDKSIRYQAMKELAKRTAGAAQPTTTDV
jgi:hypothetical protein